MEGGNPPAGVDPAAGSFAPPFGEAPLPGTTGFDAPSAKRRSPWWARLVILVGLGLLVAVFAPLVFSGGDAPSGWPARFGSIPRDVERFRGLQFDHPVPVRFLTDREFRKVIGADAGSAKETRRAAKRLAATVHATGLVEANVDLTEAASTELQASVLAFYDPETREVVVRGRGPLSVDQRVTLAHELTHVLQDQHFGLRSLESEVRSRPDGDPQALRAFIEGDANRVEDRYLRSLPRRQRLEYDDRLGAALDRSETETADVPAFISLVLSAPYRYGPPSVRAVTLSGGNGAVDRVMRRGNFTEAMFVEPASVLDAPADLKIAAPKRAEGDEAIGSSDTFGAFRRVPPPRESSRSRLRAGRIARGGCRPYADGPQRRGRLRADLDDGLGSSGRCRCPGQLPGLVGLSPRRHGQGLRVGEEGVHPVL